MKDYKYIYGPIPSRRLGRSLGIAPIPAKTCNYSCIYCQLGRTEKMTCCRQAFFPVEDIVSELKDAITGNLEYDMISIVGDGEPTLYSDLGRLIKSIKRFADKPIALITNGSLLYNPGVREDIMTADIVMPSLDAYDEITFRKINRPHGRLDFNQIITGIIAFSKEYTGGLWLEVMLVGGVNDDDTSLYKLREIIKKIKYQRLYINTPIRPPAKRWVKASSSERLEKAALILGGVSIDRFSTTLFQSGIADDYRAIISLIGRHAMRKEEIALFLQSRGNKEIDNILERLNNDENVEVIQYQDSIIYRCN